MLSFITPTALPIEAATTMGVSVKEEGAIGKFGTGLKYAIAGILRLSGEITIFVDGERHDFTARESDIRGRMFRIVHCNGTPCGFTTELGKHWEPWQLFRELASNTLDEGGSWTNGVAGDGIGQTVIRVCCREVEEAERSESVFLGKREALVESTLGATIYEGASRHYYYKGIRAGSFAGVAPVTVDVCNGELSEDRLLDLSTACREMAWAFRTATKWDESLLLSVMAQGSDTDFWVQNLPSYVINSTLPDPMLAFLAARPKFVKHKAFRAALDKHLRAGGVGRWTAIPATPRQSALIADGEQVCAAVGIDPIPRERIHFTRDLGDQALAVTCMDTRDVWFSTKLAMLGRDEFMAGYIEEAMHAMTGFADCTREFQNALLAIIVGLASQDQAQQVAA